MVKHYHNKGAYTPILIQHQQQRYHAQQQQQPVQQQPQPQQLGGRPPVSPSATATSPGIEMPGGPGKSGQNLAVSPIPGVNKRVPSPQEMAIHAQQIMQNALIKRKLKEQEENFRRRHEQDGGGVGPVGGGNNSPSLAFTPTVVMKKMAADRRDSDPKAVIPELKINQDDSGLVGGNNNKRPHELKLDPEALSPSRTSPISPSLLFRMQMEQQQQQQQQQMLMIQQQAQLRAQHFAALQQAEAQARAQQQQHPFMQQQQQLGQRPIPAMPPGGPPPPRFMHPHHPGMMAPPPPGSGMGVPGPHQPDQMLLQQGGGPGQQGLSRFFSPEVLAQAQAGNAPPLPPLPTQKAMTLEEIERSAAAVKI